MFSLIITITSIALVAALALATLYYGGSAFNKGASEAAAARHILQGQQVLGAAELFKADTGRWPDTMAEMVSGHYLRSAPSNVAQAAPVLLGRAHAEADAAPNRWTVVKSGWPVYRLLGVQSDACLSVNQKNFGVAGVLKQLRASWASQCYSPTAGSYAVIATKDEASLVDAMPEAVTHEALPEPGSARWVIRPGSRVVSAGVLPAGNASPTDISVPVTFDNEAATAPVAYTNTTGGPLTFKSAPSISGSGASAYAVTSNCPAQLAPGEGCSAQVTFNPGIAPAYSASLVFDTSAARTEVPLSGTGLPRVNPPVIASALTAFAPAKPGAPSLQVFTVTNTATTALVCPQLPVITGPDAAAFSATTDCPVSLAPGGACAVPVTFVPGAPGAQEALLTLPCHTTGPVLVPLAAVGLTLQDATPSVAQHDFQGVPRGQSLDFTVGLDNTGSALLHLLSLPRIEEDVTGAFSLAGNDCAATLAAGRGCDVTVRFSPTVLGVVSAVLAIDTDASGSPQRIALGGLGLPSLVPLAQLSASALDFGSVATNTTVTRQVTLSNPGTGALLLAVPELTASTSLAFKPGLTDCTGSLAVNASCATAVSYAPTAVGAASGTLTFATNAAGSPGNVALTGTAYNPVSLAAGTLPDGSLNQAYAPFDFASLLGVSNEASPTLSAVAWSKTGTLPAGLSLSTAGVLSGTPTALTAGAGTNFTVLATYKLNSGQQAFTLRVGEVVLEVTSISPGGRHTCAVTTAGAAKCWGLDGYGQLGNDTALVNMPTPVTVLGMSSGVASISAGTYHTCAVTTAGGAWCWGWGGFGQLGDNLSGTDRPIPVAVQGLSSGVASISAGTINTCAITTAGGVKCWGNDSGGQLGNDTAWIDSFTPVAVSGLATGVVSIGVGYKHVCALTAAGAVLCWGEDTYGQLGNGAPLAHQPVPVTVSGLTSGVASLSVAKGGYHNCVVTTTGGVKCWGLDASGQLGNDTALVNQPAPVPVLGLSSGVTMTATGQVHTCALTTAGSIKCWGEGSVSRLGTGTSLASSPTPVDMQGAPSGARSIVAGGAHSCVVTTGGAVKCWGYDADGQLGNDTALVNQSAPVNVAL